MRARMLAERAPTGLIDKGGTIAELKARCLAETGLAPPIEPVFSRRAGYGSSEKVHPGLFRDAKQKV
jgi:hypothetical protein